MSDDLSARLLLAAAIQRIAQGVGVTSVLTGGTAVDFYAAGAAGTSEGYPLKWRPSGDLDLVVLAVRAGPGGRQRLMQALARELAFEPEFQAGGAEGRDTWGRGLIVPDSPYGVELVADSLMDDPRAERVFTIEVEGEPVVFEGPEDLLVAYAESGWAFRDAREWERALAIWRAMRDEMDEIYLEKRADDRALQAVVAAVREGLPLQALVEGSR